MREPGTPFLRVQKSPIRKSRRVPFRKLLPSAPEEDFCRSSCGKPCFLAGDERANENQGMISLYIIVKRKEPYLINDFLSNLKGLAFGILYPDLYVIP